MDESYDIARQTETASCLALGWIIIICSEIRGGLDALVCPCYNLFSEYCFVLRIFLGHSTSFNFKSASYGAAHWAAGLGLFSLKVVMKAIRAWTPSRGMAL